MALWEGMVTSSTQFRELVEQTHDDRARVRALVEDKNWRDAEPDKERLSGYLGCVATFTRDRNGAESVQGDTIDYQPVSFLQTGARAQRAVAYVEVSANGAITCGSGFLISPDLFITNQHVIADADSARYASVSFDKEAGADGRPMPTTSFRLDPDLCAIFSPMEVLDYAVIAVGPRLSGTAELADLGFCPLSNRPDKHRIGMNVNIVQHPNGGPKLIAIRNNLLTHRTPSTLLYETDTDHGASGALVCNDLWEVIALHHFGQPFLQTTDDQGAPIAQAVNEGVRISAIYNDLERLLPALSGPAARLVEKALSYDKQAPAASGNRTLGPPRPSPNGSEALTLNPGGPSMPRDNSQEITVTIPIEVTVRIGNAASLAHAAPAVASAESASKSLTGGPEKKRIDSDYGNRTGYDPAFIPGVAVALPVPDAKLAKQIAPLRAEEPDAENGLLLYTHFSLVMNKAKRIAMFSATNIDGETYLVIDRATGQAASAEGDTWYKDPRLSASFVLDQSFYGAWSAYFDKGHLTRRTDPTWGAPAEAERANTDTFHFTNCSPQHFRFNESADYWQGAERYVLEKGVLADESKGRLCVFQGPIFTDAIDRWADDVQIPSSFFKIVVWKGKTGLKAVGLVVDQSALLDETRRGIARPTDSTVIKVNQWRCEIASIEKRTGLDFGAIIRAADTFQDRKQPAVGEAQRLLTSKEDILL